MTQQFKILVAEDMPDLREILVDFLSMEGHEVIQTTDGQEAWDYLQTHDLPDLLITDIMMPRMNGIDLVKKVREAYPQFCVIVYSASMNQKATVESLGCDFISKPFDIDKLMELVNKQGGDTCAETQNLHIKSH